VNVFLAPAHPPCKNCKKKHSWALPTSDADPDAGMPMPDRRRLTRGKNAADGLSSSMHSGIYIYVCLRTPCVKLKNINLNEGFLSLNPFFLLIFTFVFFYGVTPTEKANAVTPVLVCSCPGLRCRNADGGGIGLDADAQL
jgi:hypothetical protein